MGRLLTLLRKKGVRYQAILSALAGQDTPADAPTVAWLEEHYAGQPWMVLSNPTDRIRLPLRGEGTARAWWGDGAEQTEALASGSNTTFERVYASAATRGVVVLGDVREFRATTSGDLTSFGGDVANLPAGLTYLLVRGSNTLSGDVAGLPADLEFLDVWGSNELSGDVANLPADLTYLSVLGSNTLTATSDVLPAPLSHCRVSRLTVQSEVDHVLAAMVAIIGETKPRNDRVVQLNENGGAAPSAAGLADRDTLVAAGYTVTVAS